MCDHLFRKYLSNLLWKYLIHGHGENLFCLLETCNADESIWASIEDNKSMFILKTSDFQYCYIYGSLQHWFFSCKKRSFQLASSPMLCFSLIWIFFLCPLGIYWGSQNALDPNWETLFRLLNPHVRIGWMWGKNDQELSPK